MPPVKIKRVGKYELGETLGQGTFGKVKVAIDTTTNTHVAIKMMDKAKIREAKLGAQIKKEIRVMQKLNHKTCIKLHEVLASKTTIFLVEELVTGGELFDRIVADGKFDEDEARKHFISLIEGIEHCHSLGICHRDLKPENLLVDINGGLKISDFGLCSLSETGEKILLHTACGTPNYVAPEVLMDKGYLGENADIWSCGVILYVLLAGFLPFDEAVMVDLFRKIISADFQYPSWISREAQELIGIMLEPDPDKRATIDDIKNSAFYKNIKIEDKDSLQFTEDGMRKMTIIESLDTDNLTAAAAAAQAKMDAESTFLSNMSLKWKGQRSLVGYNDEILRNLHNNNLNTPSDIKYELISPSSPLSEDNHNNNSNNNNSNNINNSNSNNIKDDSNLDGPKALNAFDLINMVSGQSMNNMLLFNKSTSQHVPQLFTQFTTRLARNELMQRIDYVLLETPKLKYKICYRKCQANMVWTSNKNHKVGCHIEVFSLTPELHMIQFKRIHGPILVHHEFYKRFKDEFTKCEKEIPLSLVTAKLTEWHRDHQSVVDSFTMSPVNALLQPPPLDSSTNLSASSSDDDEKDTSNNNSNINQGQTIPM